MAALAVIVVMEVLVVHGTETLGQLDQVAVVVEVLVVEAIQAAVAA